MRGLELHCQPRSTCRSFAQPQAGSWVICPSGAEKANPFMKGGQLSKAAVLTNNEFAIKESTGKVV
jgi:hypothetical protein